MKPFVCIATLFGAAGLAQAAIVSLSNNANCYVNQMDGAGGVNVVYAYGAMPGPIVNFQDPLHPTDSGGRHWATETILNAWVSTNTPTFAQVEGYFFGSAEISGTSVPGVNEVAQTVAINVLNFTLDAPGTVSLINYNVSTGTVASSPPMVYQAKLTLDGVDYQVSALDAVFTLPVGLGTHTASFSTLVEASKFNWLTPVYSSSGFMQSQHQIKVSSVPEPGTSVMWLAALGLLALRRSRA